MILSPSRTSFQRELAEVLREHNRISRDFYARRRAKSQKGQQEFEWITIGGDADGSGAKHVGGTPVKIDKDGNIGGGPSSLVGKNLDDLDRNVAGTAKDKRKDNEPPKGKGKKKAKPEPQDEPEEHFRGDRIVLTGEKKTIGGAEFEEFEYQEGHKKGEMGWRPTKEWQEKKTEEKKRQWKEQQEQFARLHEKEGKEKPTTKPEPPDTAPTLGAPEPETLELKNARDWKSKAAQVGDVDERKQKQKRMFGGSKDLPGQGELFDTFGIGEEKDDDQPKADQKAAETPQEEPETAKSNPHQELLDRAAKFREYGENYDRSIHASARRLENVIENGREKSIIDHWANELKQRLDAKETPQDEQPPTDTPEPEPTPAATPSDRTPTEQAILDHLDKTGMTGLRDIGNAVGIQPGSREDPLASELNRSLKKLVDDGVIGVHNRRFGEPDFYPIEKKQGEKEPASSEGAGDQGDAADDQGMADDEPEEISAEPETPEVETEEISQNEFPRQKRIDALKKAIENNRKNWDRQVETPGAFVTGRSGRSKSLDRQLDRENNRMADAFKRHQEMQSELDRLEAIKKGWEKGEVHPNGQPVSRQKPPKNPTGTQSQDHGAKISRSFGGGDNRHELSDGTVLQLRMEDKDGDLNYFVAHEDQDGNLLSREDVSSPAKAGKVATKMAKDHFAGKSKPAEPAKTADEPPPKAESWKPKARPSKEEIKKARPDLITDLKDAESLAKKISSIDPSLEVKVKEHDTYHQLPDGSDSGVYERYTVNLRMFDPKTGNAETHTIGNFSQTDELRLRRAIKEMKSKLKGSVSRTNKAVSEEKRSEQYSRRRQTAFVKYAMKAYLQIQSRKQRTR